MACAATAGQVRYLGRVPHDYKLELLQRARCLVSPLCPPYIEIFGLSTIESQACGTPVVSTDLGAPSELIVEGATGAVANDVTCLATSVHNALLCKPDDCRAQAERFPREKMGADYEALYQEMMEGRRW